VSIRIYVLAKELKLDSKVLVDICAKAGVEVKGSALASLTDEEVEKVRAYLGSTKGGQSVRAGTLLAKGAAARTSPTVFRREDYIPPAGVLPGKVPVLPAKVERPPVAPKKPEPPPTPPPAPLVEPVVEKVEKVEKEKVEKVKEEREKEPLEHEEKGKGVPIKLAPLPPAARLPLKPKPAEPPPQKPDLKLPLDAIRARKAGEKPLSEHLRKHEQKRQAAQAEKALPQRKAPPTEKEKLPPVEPPPLGGRQRLRKPTRPIPLEEEEDGLLTLGGREQRQLKRKKAAAVRRRKVEPEEEEATPTPIIRKRTHIQRTGANTAAPRRESVCLALPCTVRSFSEAIGVSLRTILGKLLELGTMCNATATLEPDLAELLAAELNIPVRFQRPVDIEEQLLKRLEDESDPTKLKFRPPIVTFLGHVDHGKTSLLDRIIGINVTAQEKGGITQHIRAYQVEKEGRAITFVDTPGHEAFTEMRARGANVTDIAVLVLAADDGVMPQTEEAISHARAANVPIVVALNKIDLPGVNPQRIYEQLAANELLPSEWGGDTEVLQTSAVTGAGIDKLLETLLTVAELHELKANPDQPACGTCLEAELHEGRGVVAKLLVRKGTLRPGDIIVCGNAYGRVKAMYDTLDARRRHKEAGPSMPVNVTGLNCPPAAGERFYALEEVSQARELAERRAAAARASERAGLRPHITLENLYERLSQESQVKTLNIILRADTRGSIEAIRKELGKLQHPEVQIKMLQAMVGGVTEADVHLAHASDAVILAFAVAPDEKARSLAERLGVQIRRYDIIYQVSDDIKAALEGMLRPQRLEKELGRALVQRTFHISRIGTVAGCRVVAGIVQRDARAKVIRDSRVIGDYPIESLKREKDDAREVREGLECGLKLAGFNDVKEGDVLEIYRIEEVARTL